MITQKATQSRLKPRNEPSQEIPSNIIKDAIKGLNDFTPYNISEVKK